MSLQSLELLISGTVLPLFKEYPYGHRQNYGKKKRIIFRSCFAVDEFSIIVFSLKGYAITKMISQSSFPIISRFPSVSFHNCIFPTDSVVLVKSGWFCPDGIFHNYFFFHNCPGSRKYQLFNTFSIRLLRKKAATKTKILPQSGRNNCSVLFEEIFALTYGKNIIMEKMSSCQKLEKQFFNSIPIRI